MMINSYGQDWHWRNSQRSPRFFMLDFRACFGLLLWMMHARMWTLIIAGIIMVVFVLFERRGLTFSSALRAIRSWLVGVRRPAVIWTRKRRYIDYG